MFGSNPLERYLITCEVEINGEKLKTRAFVDAHAWRDPVMREFAEREIRQRLGDEIIKKLNPRIRVES